jgi:glutamate racemase
LLATPGTVQRAYTDELIAQFAGSCRVIKVGSNALVELAERKLQGAPAPLAAVAGELAPLFAQSPTEAHARLDVVVLGCTHFPLLRDELMQTSPWPVTWIDSSEAIASRIDYLVTERGLKAAAVQGMPPAPTAYFTKADAGVDALRPALTALGFGGVALL